MSTELDLAFQHLSNGLFVEASAGTGKTYSIAALITRELALDDDLRIGHLLVTTFTRNAAAELQDRVRRRLIDSAAALRRGSSVDNDAVLGRLLDCDDAERMLRARRLERAVVEYDSATIATIHSICNKILLLAGEGGSAQSEDERSALIDEVVNDLLVVNASKGPPIDESKLRDVVDQSLSEPLTRLWFDRSGRSPEQLELLGFIERSIGECTRRIESLPADEASFDDLIRRAREIVSSPLRAAMVEEFRRRYRYIIVDEAQDTDAQQWAIFRSLFPMVDDSGSGALIAVGDPKQSIYKFRGADIDAYRTERDRGDTVTLATNFRSDEAVLEGLNDLFSGSQFGEGIGYVAVRAPEGKVGSVLTGAPPVEVVSLPGVTAQPDLATLTARKVASCLAGSVNIDGALVRPRDVVVLVKSGQFGRMVEKRLRGIGIPAVSTGTESVMGGESAEHWRVLLRALERYNDAGRVRHVLATPLFAVSLTSPLVLSDDFIGEVQEALAVWAAILRRSGVAALSAAILSDAATITSLSSGRTGERRLTDFSHITDLLHAHTGRRGCSPRDALDALHALSQVDPTSELVSRRVESDADAVQIMTIHTAKGLEFPVVVVADTWKPDIPRKKSSVPVFRLLPSDNAGVVGRVIDVGWIVDLASPIGDARRDTEAIEEYRRQLYVAATRAQHHVSVLYPTDVKGSVLTGVLDAGALAGQRKTVVVSTPDDFHDFDPAEFARHTTDDAPAPLSVAPSPANVAQTYRRTSFTGLVADQKGRATTPRGRLDVLPGGDEGESILARRSGYASHDIEPGVASMPLARIPGGTYVGKVLHEVYQHVDPSVADLRAHVADVVDQRVSGRLIGGHRQSLVDGITASLLTPLGGPLGSVTLRDIGAVDRLAELGFEMSLPHLSRNLTARHIGVLLDQSIGKDDPLKSYATVLCDPSFDVPLAGLINGSIDALLRLVDADGRMTLFVADYKSNRLDLEDDATLIEAYRAARMADEMFHHHYPLQAIIYGAAVHRFLRWRSPNIDADAAIGGFAYLFIRGMVGPETPVDDLGNRHGVFTWTAPRGFWSRLSDLFAGDLP